ncbi:MAG: DUF6049 family protein [Dermatophilaceae bacterium]
MTRGRAVLGGGSAGSRSRGARRAVITALASTLVVVLWLVVGASPDFGMPSASASALLGSSPRQGSVTARHHASLSTVATPFAQPGTLVLTSVSPAVAGPTTPVVVTGTIRSVEGEAFANPTVRVVRGRSSVTTQDALDAWVASGDPTAGSEIGRVSVPGVVAPGAPLTFSVTLSPDSVRLTRAYGAVPIVIDVQSNDGQTRGLIRTFVGWQRAPEYTPISLATVVPITLDPDPALQALDPAVRGQAWIAAVGSASRLARLVTAAGRGGIPLSYAVDPAILGPLKVAGKSGAQEWGVGRSPPTGGRPGGTDPAAGRLRPRRRHRHPHRRLRCRRLWRGRSRPWRCRRHRRHRRHRRPRPIRRRHPARWARGPASSRPWRLPPLANGCMRCPRATSTLRRFGRGTPDRLSSARRSCPPPASRQRCLQPCRQPRLQGRPARFLGWPGPSTACSPRVSTSVCGRHTAPGPMSSCSSAATTRTGELTPEGAARTAAGTPVARWDDRLSDIAAHAGDPLLTAEVLQRFAAQSAVLLAERPSIRRDAVVALPRGLDPDAAALSRFLQDVRTIPWLTPVGLDAVADPRSRVDDPDCDRTADRCVESGFRATSGAASGAASGDRSETTSGAPSGAVAPTVLTDGVLPAITERQAALVAYRVAQPNTVGDVTTTDRWVDIALTLTSVRWRTNPTGFRELLQGLDGEVAAVSAGLGIVPQTANFLADEGILLITVANDLDLPVADITVHLAPTNARMAVSEPITPISIAARSKATVPVRMIAVAQGLVPIDAWLTGPDGARVGSSTTIQVRAAPPGAWLYVVAGAGLLALLIVGAWRSLRRPSRVPDSVVLDPGRGPARTPARTPARGPARGPA